MTWVWVAAADALGDAELVSKLAGEVADLDLVDSPERRWLTMHLRDEIGDRLRRAADPHQYAVGVVEHFAREPVCAGKPPHRRAKADALHAAAHADLDRRHFRDGAVQVHGAASHNRTRLLPESATTSVAAAGRDVVRPAQTVAGRRGPAIVALVAEAALTGDARRRHAHGECREIEREEPRIGGVGHHQPLALDRDAIGHAHGDGGRVIGGAIVVEAVEVRLAEHEAARAPRHGSASRATP